MLEMTGRFQAKQAWLFCLVLRLQNKPKSSTRPLWNVWAYMLRLVFANVILCILAKYLPIWSHLSKRHYFRSPVVCKQPCGVRGFFETRGFFLATLQTILVKSFSNWTAWTLTSNVLNEVCIVWIFHSWQKYGIVLIHLSPPDEQIPQTSTFIEVIRLVNNQLINFVWLGALACYLPS